MPVFLTVHGLVLCGEQRFCLSVRVFSVLTTTMQHFYHAVEDKFEIHKQYSHIMPRPARENSCCVTEDSSVGEYGKNSVTNVFFSDLLSDVVFSSQSYTLQLT